MIATGHRLWGSEIVGQDLRDASFDNCDLFGVAFRQCDLRGATFRNTVLTGLIVDDCTWENNDFTNAVINGIVRQFEDDFTGVTNESLLTTWSFKNKDLSKCYIPSDGGTGYDFSQFGANFEDAVVTNTTFWECTGLTREQIFSTWNSKARRMNGIVLPKE